jgi:ubiquinone/menaquinone biosynthesis C-methylase UbiE
MNRSDSWESSSSWYDKIVGKEGHYYHQTIVVPGVLKLLELTAQAKIADLACGQGILARHLPKDTSYVGFDASSSLIHSAAKLSRDKAHRFLVADVTAPLPIKEKDFSHATIILALQNIEEPWKVLKNAAALLKTGGKLVICLSHPCFRIPRQSSWQVDPAKKTQFRRIDRYFSPLAIPIHTHPSKREESPTTTTYHFPLSNYTLWLKEAGFVIEVIEEWLSDKKSTGPAATMENRARGEFPLFLALRAQKL